MTGLLMENCSIIAKANMTTPSESLLIRVLRDNGFSGSVGLKFLHENYGNVVSHGDSGSLMFCGIHIGSKFELMSNHRLQWNHQIRHHPMIAGFFRRQEMAEYARFQSLKSKLGTDIEVDVVGCIAHREMCSDIGKAVLRPPAEWWLGICDRGWLGIDLNFFLLDIYESLSELLSEKCGIELIAENNKKESEKRRRRKNC